MVAMYKTRRNSQLHSCAPFVAIFLTYLLSNSNHAVAAVNSSSHVQHSLTEKEGDINAVGEVLGDDGEDSMDDMAELFEALPEDGVALQLVAPTEDRRRFKVNPVALSVLESIEEPVAILAAVGPYHG